MKIFKCIDVDNTQDVVKAVSLWRETSDVVYYFPSSNSGGLLDESVLSLCDSRRLFVASIDVVIETELCVVPLEVVSGSSWWDYPIAVEKSGFVSIKRIFDIVASSVFLCFALPFLIVVGLVVKFQDRGPILYKQIRLGQYGKSFSIFKIRSMRVDSETNGAQWATVQDPRVTWMGNIIRKTRIDEVPQLWNVIRGDMSLIGPRPERPEFYSIIAREIPEFYLRLAFKPGLTGWAQVNYQYGASIKDSKMKLMYDLYYLKNSGVLLDLRIVTRTILAMVKGAR